MGNFLLTKCGRNPVAWVPHQLAYEHNADTAVSGPNKSLAWLSWVLNV